MKRSALLATLGAFSLTGCATAAVDHDRSAEIVGAAGTELRDAAGRSLGSANVTQSGDNFRVRIVSTAMPAGVHGAHLHTTGSCQPPDFASAGPHWNPTGRLHGTQNPQGPHLGDMPNLLVGTDGRGTLEFVVPSGQLERGDRPLLDRDGAAVVIHAAADDHRTDPSGNSGSRIACGMLQVVMLR